MFDSFSNFFDSSPLDGLLTHNKSVLDEMNEDIFYDINLHAPASRISVIINNIQLNFLSSMVLIISHNNTITPIGPLYENININTLEYINYFPNINIVVIISNLTCIYIMM